MRRDNVKNMDIVLILLLYPGGRASISGEPAMEDITIKMLTVFITGRVMTTDCTWMKGIYRRSNTIDMRMKSGKRAAEVMSTGIKTGDISRMVLYRITRNNTG